MSNNTIFLNIMADFHTHDYIREEDFSRFQNSYNAELRSGKVSPETQFQYGWCLIKSQYKDDIRKGIKLLEALCATNMDSRDFLYFIALGYYKLSEYDKALRFVKRLLNIEPNNAQAKELEKSIESKMKSDGVMGIAMVGGAAIAAVGGIVLGLLLAKRR
ncbi:mitochondrial fission 1 protein isoform X2 [Hydra vulgaris]|uniref:mitochondrial fission 1 protein isoform X2 n=1 Tax=Hydra vulgaris TaxID=6087 RepID=UPI001F5F2963|nr:mitochondrial fission 1 protein isoform X2 [Hydra vulgaris]